MILQVIIQNVHAAFAQKMCLTGTKLCNVIYAITGIISNVMELRTKHEVLKNIFVKGVRRTFLLFKNYPMMNLSPQVLKTLK